MRARRLLLCLPLLTAASGCGFLFTHGPPTGHEHLADVPCTESDAGPILDLAWGGLNVVTALSIATSPDVHGDAPAVILAYGVGWGVVSGFSAASGFKKTSACKRARVAWAQRQVLRDSVGVMAVVVTPAADTLAVGAQRQLTVAAHNSSGATVSGRMFSWSSSNDAIASVSNAGLVTAHAPGSVIIAANTNNLVGTATIVVTGQR